MQWPQQAQRTSSTLRPYDEDTSDQTVQYLEICQMDQPLQASRMTAVFRAAMIDEVQADGTIRTVPLGDGPWELSFDFTPKASSIDLPTGQQFQVDGLDCTLTRVSLSPLSLHVEYTVDAAEVPDENAFLNALPLFLTKQTGLWLTRSETPPAACIRIQTATRCRPARIWCSPRSPLWTPSRASPLGT